MSDVRTIMERGVGSAAPPPDGFERMLRRRDRKQRNQRITAGTVGIAVFVAAVWIVTTGGPVDRALTPGGAGTATGPTATGPTIAPEGVPGFVEQHLTPAGVEFLQTQVISTGLFEDDLALLRGPGDPPFLTIRVRNGDRLVWLTWAVEENYRVPKDAPPAAPEQGSALEGVYALLTDPTSGPASAWGDQDLETFVPSRYQVSLRDFPTQGPGPEVSVGARELALLPAPAVDILRRCRQQ